MTTWVEWHPEDHHPDCDSLSYSNGGPESCNCEVADQPKGSMSETHKNENAAWMIYRQDALRCWVFAGAISRTGDGSPEAPSGGVIETAGDACEAMARRTGQPGHYAAFSAPVTIVDLKQRA